jgi:hypothetical protein
MIDDWRQRLRDAVKRSGRKHSAIAWDAGITQVTLSRILNRPDCLPLFTTVCRIAHAVGETVGWLLDEEGFHVNREQRVKLRAAATIILSVTRDQPVAASKDRQEPPSVKA